MGCFGRKEEDDFGDFKAEHQWSFITLSDFTSSSFLTPLSYGILYISLVISVGVYVVDIFTCSQLLLFDKWSGKIEPAVPLYISRWVFTGCILLVLLVYRWWKAIRAIKTGSITRSYLDPLAVRLQSVRMGARGRGWRRFLVFAELTKSKKGVEYVALFTYFSFEAWIRIVFAEGPRQGINAVTLAALMQKDVVPIGDHQAKDGNSPAGQFFVNLQAIANEDKLRAAVLFGMLFTVVIWIFSALSLIISTILYLVFLWHHIPEPSLRKFCKGKIESRLQKIVDTTVKKALAKEDMKRAVEAAKGGDFKPYIKRQPTLPQLDNSSTEKLLEMPSISRQTTVSTLPEYSGPPTAHYPMPDMGRQPTLPYDGYFPSRPPPTRSATQSSKASYATAPSVLNSGSVSRPGTASTVRPPMRQGTDSEASTRSGFTSRPYPPPSRGLSSMSNSTFAARRQNTQSSNRSFSTARSPAPSSHPSQRSAHSNWYPTQPPSTSPTELTSPYSMSNTPAPLAGRFVAYRPQPALPEPPLPALPEQPRASHSSVARNFSAPHYRTSSEYSMPQQRGPPPPQRPGLRMPFMGNGAGDRGSGAPYDPSIVDSYARDSQGSGRVGLPPQAATAGPGGNSGAWF